jgi:hypothetical protein
MIKAVLRFQGAEFKTVSVSEDAYEFKLVTHRYPLPTGPDRHPDRNDLKLYGLIFIRSPRINADDSAYFDFAGVSEQ